MSSQRSYRRPEKPERNKGRGTSSEEAASSESCSGSEGTAAALMGEREFERVEGKSSSSGTLRDRGNRRTLCKESNMVAEPDGSAAEGGPVEEEVKRMED